MKQDIELKVYASIYEVRGAKMKYAIARSGAVMIDATVGEKSSDCGPALLIQPKNKWLTANPITNGRQDLKPQRYCSSIAGTISRIRQANVSASNAQTKIEVIDDQALRVSP